MEDGKSMTILRRMNIRMFCVLNLSELLLVL